MKLYLSCTANLGDFMNAMPVISGLVKKHGKLDFIAKKELKKFKGVREFLEYQELFNSVYFDDELFLYNVELINLSSWTRRDKNNPIRPSETCGYENWMRDNYNLDFEVDDDFELKVPYYDNMDYKGDLYIVADRWSLQQDPTLDIRRASNVIEDGIKSSIKDKFFFMDFDAPLLDNCSLIKYNSKPFISTFTGSAVLSDLMNKETIILYDDDMIGWIDRTIEQTFDSHFYKNRKSTTHYIRNFDL